MGRHKESNIYLLGFMGSGKSTLAPLLAMRMGKTSFDTDDWIERQIGKSVSQIFHEHGEEFFRKKEKECIELVTQMSNLVVALGGGAVLNDESWKRVRNSGISVYLKCSPQEIEQRIDGGNVRPLLAGDIHRRRQTIEALLAERERRYAQADLTVNAADGKSPEEIVELILNELEGLP